MIAPCRVLVIDDNPEIHEIFRGVLAAIGASPDNEPSEIELPRFSVDCVDQGEEGLTAVACACAAGQPYSIAFVDLRMGSGWNGIETIAQLWNSDPHLEVVLCTAFTGYSPLEIARHLHRLDQLLLLKKPFDNIVVQQLAIALAAKWRLARESESHFASLEAQVQTRTRELERDIDERLRLEAQLRQSQKMESVGQLAGGIAHDFNNLLTVINGHASLLLAAEKLSPKGADSLKEIIEAGQRAGNLTRQLLTFSRKQEIHPQIVDLNDVVRQMARMLHRILGEDVELQADFAPDLPAIKADLGMMEQVLMNLAVNSRDAMPRGGQLQIATSVVTFDEAQTRENPEAAPGSFVCLSFSDTGVGIAPENLGRIFEPFFTTKEIHRGTGLGLATVYGIVKQHQGWITVRSRLGEGATFLIYFPACFGQSAGIKITPAEARVLGGAETILVVEDEVPLLKLIGHILENHGYKVLHSTNGHEALALWEQHRQRIDMLLTDLILPDNLGGPELARILQAAKPSLKVLYTSGYDADRVAKEFPPGEKVNWVQKPFHAHRLAETVQQTLHPPAA